MIQRSSKLSNTSPRLNATSKFVPHCLSFALRYVNKASTLNHAELPSVQIAQRLFKDRVQAGQIRNYWNNNAFAKYKAIRPQVSHTGGGDPDAARSQSPAQSGSGEHPQKTTDITFKATGKFSSEILHAFYESKLYDLIDAVYVILTIRLISTFANHECIH